MKNIALMLLVCSLNIASAQIADSLVIRQRIDSLIQVSRSLTANRDFDHALGVNAIAEQMALEWRGARSAEYGDCAFNRGRVNIFKGDYQEAEDWYLKAKDIRQEVLGVEHPDYAWSLNNLAILYKDVGHYEKAEPLYLQAKAIRGNVLGPDHPLYAASLNNLANFYMNSGNYEKAEPLYLEANGIRKKVLGKAHPDYAWSVDNLAILYWNMGDYKKAEPLFLEAKSIREVTLGKTHHEYASSLNNLAVLYKDMGSYDKAEPLYIEAIAIRETILGKAHPDYAFSLNNLALLYRELGNYEKAEPLYLEASEILLNILGDRHPDYAASLNNLASLYIGLGDLKQAESLNLQAKRIWGDIYGKGHPNYALSLSNLATLYKDIGDYDEAEKLFLEALAIRENVQGKSHPNFASSLFELAHLYARQSRHSDSEPLLEEAFQLSIRSLVNAMSFLSEKELGNYVATLKSEGHFLSAYLDARQARGTPLGVLPPLMYDHALIYKGFLLTAATSISAPSLASPESLEINNRLKGFRRRLAAEYTKPVAERKGVAELEEKANEAEKELARSVAGYAEALQQVKWQDVRSALTSEAIALELIHFPVNFPRGTDSVMYAALLLKPGDDQPLYIPLFEERELDHLLSVDKERKADYVNELYAWADRGMVKLGSAKKSLYELIWSKIEAAGLEGIKTVYYSPSGVLHRLNLGAIAVDEETILSDMYNLVAMNSTRQLAIPTTVTTKANDALLVGGVNFEMDSVQISLKEEPLMAIRSSAESWTESGTRGGSWSYLRWTEKEVERIVTSLTTAGFDAVQITGADATEEAIKSIGTRGPSPLILHIATHGFFFPDPEIAPSSRRGLGVGESVFKSSDNPMIRSGLILAGGNYAWQHGRPVSPDREDGILTAYEISQMNLANTELVVLSACETGLGDIQGNEGVYGLQRAFKIAGAKYLIMSLWQVPDRETMEFMTTFYRNWLEQGLTIPDAFRKTQREMRDRFINPYSWGAFVLLE